MSPHPRIVFLCPSVIVINGGIRHIFRMAETLIAQGRDAVVFEQTGARPRWFASSAPVVGQDIFVARDPVIYVVPEDQPHILAEFASLPQRKVLYSQNHFYGALGIANAASYADYGITDILCSSQTIYDHSCIRHPQLNAHLIPCAIDRNLFRPKNKQKSIAFMPRKRPIEAVYLRDMFRFSYPAYRNWQWKEITEVTENEAAHIMAEAAVFLSLSRLEGFGLSPLEAMASGCVVAGFTGIGGREYGSTGNGFWVNEDDHNACVDALAQAVELSQSPEPLITYQDACQETLSAYTPSVFAASVKRAWDTILN